MTIQELITKIRTALDEETPETWSNNQILAEIQAGDDEIYTELLDENCYLLRKYTDISLVASTRRYALPTDFYRVADPTDSDYDPRKPIPIIEPSHRYGHDLWSAGPLTCYFEPPHMVVSPEPAVADTDRVRLYYAPTPARLTTGTASAGAATTITLASTATTGTTSAADDEYNDRTVAIDSGAGIGQKRLITDYVGSTRVVTVATWDTTPGATSVYCIMPVTPELFHQILADYGCWHCLLRGENPAAAVYKAYYDEGKAKAMERLKRQYNRFPPMIRRRDRYSI